MRRHFKLILLSTLVLLLAGTFWYVRKQRKQTIVTGVNSHSSHDSAIINETATKLVRNYREVLDSQLPPFALASASGEKLSENLVRQGNVVLVFLASDCKACMENGDFFKTIVNSRKDVKYYGVRPYDKKSESGEPYVNVVPFAVYFDLDHRLSRYLGIRGVPVAVFLKDGTVKRIWGGVAISEQETLEFNSWLSSLYG